MKKNKLVLGIIVCILGMLCFASCEDDYSSSDSYVGYNDHDDDWGKCSLNNNDCNYDTCSYDVTLK